MQELIQILNLFIPMIILLIGVLLVISIILFFFSNNKSKYKAQTIRAILSLFVSVLFMPVIDMTQWVFEIIPTGIFTLNLVVVSFGVWWVIQDLVK